MAVQEHACCEGLSRIARGVGAQGPGREHPEPLWLDSWCWWQNRVLTLSLWGDSAPTLVGLLDCRPGLFPDADTFPPLWASQHTVPSARLGSSPEIECPAPRGPKGHTWYRKHCPGWGACQQRCTDTRCPCASSRHRGLIHAYEFAVDRLAFQSALPICRASGDSVPGYNYDLALAFP